MKKLYHQHFYNITIVVSAAVPEAPAAPVASEICSKSCVLTWQPPASDGGAPVTGYVIERRTGQHWLPLKKKITTTSFTVQDLMEGTKYEFRVLAENKIGLSKPSAACPSFVAKDPWGRCSGFLYCVRSVLL